MESLITEILNKKFTEEGFEGCFVVKINLVESDQLEVFIDSDTGITVGICAKVNRFLSEHTLEGANTLGDTYSIDVSSPGVGEPLLLERQYHKNIGRTLEVVLKSGTEEKTEVLNGTLKAVKEGGIVLQTTEKLKEGKKKKTIIKEIEIGFESIKTAVVLARF